MTQLESEAVYKDLKQQGLNLAIPTILIIPEEESRSPTLFERFGGFLKRDQSENLYSKIIAIPVLYSGILVAKNNMIYTYKYRINEQTSELSAKHIQIINWTYKVKKISVCTSKYVRDRSDIPLVIETDNGFGFFMFDLKQSRLQEKNFIKSNKLLTVSMMSDKQALSITQQGLIKLYIISRGFLKQKCSLKTDIILEGQQKIEKTWILSNIDEQVESVITLFYAVTIPSTNNRMILRVKQIERSVDGEIIIRKNSDYKLETDSLFYRQNLLINSVGNYYCVQMPTEILIVKKKFNKYMIMDSISQRYGKENRLSLNRKGIIVSIENKALQLSAISFADPKSTPRICDVIDFPTELEGLEENFIEAWPIIAGKQYTLIFSFIKENKIYLSNLLKSEPLQKMLDLAQNSHKELAVLRDMAINLNISNKDFYLKLWSHSKKQHSDIFKYLIPCKDVPSIKKELQSLLRRKTIPVSEMLKILDKISQIITQSLTVNLSQVNLKQYLKNAFLRRKLKLREMNKKLDHRSFHQIYESSILSIITDIIIDQIDPVEPIHDPLHPIVDEAPIKQIKSLQNVFQQFKVLLLQNYKEFVIQILSKFPQKILQILKNFNFLLPNYPFDISVQKPSIINEPIIKDEKDFNNYSQPLWFQEVTVSEWKTEITKESIFKSFSFYHADSKINEAANQFINSQYGRQHKRGRHGLISLSLSQFTEQVQQIQGIKLYLQVCQFANQKSIETNDDPELSIKILQILQKKNKLIQASFEYCKLYAKMHYFMLKNNIIQKQNLKINQLTKLKSESLVALFFLQNKQRKQFIFRDFMRLYHTKTEFEEVLRKFVQSQNCSKIQLEILMKQLIQMGVQFQRQNQEVIQILLIGECMKLQIRQNPAILENQNNNQQINLINNLQISKNLAFKINKIKQLRRCQDIFKKFKLSKMTYEQLISLEDNNQIFKLLLDKYFNNQMTDQYIEIEQQTIDLQSPRNMLTILIYLQETVYYDVKTFDLMIQYGLILIQWKEFEVIKSLLEQTDVFEALQIKSQIFVEVLIQRALDTIYLDLQIIYDEQTKEQIINVINIDSHENQIRIQQLAKLELVEIFQSWKCSIHPSDIHTICHEWSESHRRQFIEDLIEQYIDQLNFQTFEAIYTQLEIVDRRTNQINIQNQQYVQFCIMYAIKLLDKGRYKQAIQVITFIKSFANVLVGYALQTEAFLKSISTIYPQNQQIGRQMIEFLLENNNSQSDYKVEQLFGSYFDETCLSTWQRQETIKVKHSLFYKNVQGQCEYKLDDLWEMAKYGTKSSQQIYYNYYFLINSIIKPEVGLRKLRRISYNLQQITDLILIHIDTFNGYRKQFWIINFDQILLRFIKGLADQAIRRLDINLETQGANKLDAILDSLKDNRVTNNQLIKSLTRVRQEIKSKLKKNERNDRFFKLLEEITIKKEKQREQRQRQEDLNAVDQQPQQQKQIFLCWKKIEEQKKNISNRSQFFISQKDLLDQVYDSLGEINEHEPKKSKTVRRQILANLFLPAINNIQNIDLLVDMIRKEQFDRATNYSPSFISEALKILHKQQLDIDPYQLVDMMQTVKIGDLKKIQIFKLTKYFRGTLSNRKLNTLFNYDFFMKPLETEEDFKYAEIYEELRPQITEIIKDITPDGLKDLAHLLGNSLESTEYSALAFFETLLYLGRNETFTSKSAILAHQCVQGLGEYPEIIARKYEDLFEKPFLDEQMQKYFKENLFKLMQEKGYEDIAKSIKVSA